MLADALTGKGYDTRVAHDAPTALRVAAEFSPDVAFLDIGLPVMDGYELAAHLREIARPRGPASDRRHRLRPGVGSPQHARRGLPPPPRQAGGHRRDRIDAARAGTHRLTRRYVAQAFRLPVKYVAQAP